MSREDDDAYFQRLNEEGIGIWDEGDSQPVSRVSRQASPLPPTRHLPAAAMSPQTPDDNDYFANLSVFQQGDAYEAPTMRIPYDIIKQLETGTIPGQQQAEPVPTKVERRDGFVTRVSGSLAEPSRSNITTTPQGRDGNRGGWSR